MTLLKKTQKNGTKYTVKQPKQQSKKQRKTFCDKTNTQNQHAQLSIQFNIVFLINWPASSYMWCKYVLISINWKFRQCFQSFYPYQIHSSITMYWTPISHQIINYYSMIKIRIWILWPLSEHSAKTKMKLNYNRIKCTQSIRNQMKSTQ